MAEKSAVLGRVEGVRAQQLEQLVGGDVGGQVIVTRQLFSTATLFSVIRGRLIVVVGVLVLSGSVSLQGGATHFRLLVLSAGLSQLTATQYRPVSWGGDRQNRPRAKAGSKPNSA